MKTILVSAFSNISSNTNSRILSIYNQIEGEKIVVTSDFCHGDKSYCDKDAFHHPNQINLHVPAYQKNLSIKRIWSHIIFAIQVKKYLMALEEKPDAIYCAMPTSSSAYVCAKICKKYGIKFVIDVIDLWPDSLIPLIKGAIFIKIGLYPWSYLTEYAYKTADVIIGESVEYTNVAKKINKKAIAYPIYLGIDIDNINKVKQMRTFKLDKPEGEIWIGYAGRLGNSYDFDYLLNAISFIHGKFKYKLWFIGDGVKHKEIESDIKKKGLNGEITGFLSYDKLLLYLSYCDIAVNIFRDNTKVVYSYKFNDYVAMNCFVLNSLKGETAVMVDKYKIGRNFDVMKHPLPQVLENTLANWDMYSMWRENCQKLIEEKLDKKKIYSIIKNIFQ